MTVNSATRLWEIKLLTRVTTSGVKRGEKMLYTNINRGLNLLDLFFFFLCSHVMKTLQKKKTLKLYEDNSVCICVYVFLGVSVVV